MEQKHGGAVRVTLSVTLIVFVSKFIGFIRSMVLGYYFGISAQTDAYNTAYSIYNIPILMFMSCITSTLIPMYLDADKHGGRLEADRFGSNALNLFALASVALSVLMYALADPIVRIVYARFDEERMRMTIEMTRIMMPSLVFVTTSIVQSSIMNAREKYLAGQLSGFPYSVATIAFMWLFVGRWGIKAVAWGTALAGLLQMLIIIPFHKGAFKYSWAFDLKDPRVKRMIILAAPSMASMAVNEFNHMIDQFMASGLPKGDISAMTLSFQMITLILGVVTVPIITVMFSRMSKRAAENDKQAIIDMVMQSIEVMCLVLLPIMALAGVFSLDVFKLLFMRGRFDHAAAANTASIFVMYLLGVIFYGIKDLLNRSFHAIQNTKVPLYTSLTQLALNVMGNVILIRYMGAAGLALSTAISCLIASGLQFYLLRGRLGRMHYQATLVEVLKCLVAMALSMLAALVLDHFVPEVGGTIRVLGRLIACTVPCLLVYLGALMLLRARQLSFLKTIVRR